MSQETELERLVVRLVGDASQYQRMLTDAKKSSNNAAIAVEKAGKRMEAIQKRLQSVGGAIRGVGKKLSMMVTAPIAAFSALAGRETVKFETTMSRIVGLVGLSTEVTEEFGEKIKGMAANVGKGPVELAEAMFSITSAGLRGDAALEALEVSARAASAGLGETINVADAVTNAMNAYGQENLSATRSTEILTGAVRAGKASAESFAPVLGQILPNAKAMGIEFESVAGSLAFLTKTTGNASLAATGLKGVMRALDKPAKEVIKKLETQGVSLEKLQKNFADMDMASAMKELEKSLAKAGISVTEFFTDSEGRTAARQMLSGMDDYVNVLGQVTDSVGIVDDAFQAWEQTMGAQFAKQMARTKVLLIDLGNFVAPVMGYFLDMSEMAINAWNKLSKPIQKIIAMVAAVAAAIGPVVVGLGIFVAGLGSALAGAGAAITFLIQPLTLVGLALAGVAVALIPWKTIWNQIMALWSKGQVLWQGFSANIEHNLKELKIFALSVWVRIQEVARQVWLVIVDVVSWAVDSIMGLFGVTEDDISKVWDGVKNKSKSTWESITNGVKKFVEYGLGFMSNFRENMGILWDWIKGAWSKVWENGGTVLKAYLKFYIEQNAITLRTATRLWNAWSGWQETLYTRVGKFFVITLMESYKKDAINLANWSGKAGDVIQNTLKGNVINAKESAEAMVSETTEALEQMQNDIEAGRSEANFFITAKGIIDEELENLEKAAPDLSKTLDLPAAPKFKTDYDPISLPELLFDMPGEEVGKELGEDVAKGVKEEIDKVPPPLEFQAIVNVKYEANTASLVGTAESLARRATYEAGKGIRKEQEKAVSEYVPVGKRGGDFNFGRLGGGRRGVGTSTRGMTGGGGEDYNEWGADRLNSRFDSGFGGKEVGGEGYTNWATDRLNARFDENFAPPRDRVQEFQDVGGGKTVGTSEYDKWLESRTKEDKAQEIVTVLQELAVMQREFINVFIDPVVLKESSLQ